MANKKISSLTSLGGTPDVADIIPITDVSDTTGSAQGTTKKVTVANLVAAAPQGDLLASNNLSDLGSNASARTNLGLGTAATSASTDFSSAFFSTVSETTTSRTLSDSDNGKVIVCSNASATTITVPSGLTSGFGCTVVQGGSGVVSVVGSGASVNGIGGKVVTAGQYAALNIVPIGTNSYILDGDGQTPLFTNAYSLSFDGSNEYVALGGTQASGNNTFHFGTNPFSVSAWVKPSALSGNDQIVGAHGGSGWTMYSSSGTLTFFAAIGNLAGGSLTQDAWNHCLVTRDGTSFNMYLNGNKTSHTISGTATANTKATITTNIGWDTGSLQPLLGLIDEVATWNVALSDADVTSLYNSGTSVTDLNDSGSYDTDRSDNLVTWYRNGDTGTDATSSTVTNAASGSANAGSSVDGSLQNSPTFVSGSGNTPGN